ncbi:MAG: hypothetical protein M0R33_17385 [Methylomonas sp.]|jgi:hypothetical protein|uniref:hypothetical protein n=1 Tax=Methylomonas sp. TaxID=418 RepID=UPI0025F591F7|nr:hypothetical protein [Methylomonas sp.]MCK9608221.1 hypothetical protein [Methylomonas sp.]
MKCLYYLYSGLDSAHANYTNLGDTGLNTFKTHSGRHYSQSDMPAVGILGVSAGVLFGLLTAALMDGFHLFGADLPLSAYIGLTLFWSLFDAWGGGLVRIIAEKRKTALFQAEPATGGFLRRRFTPHQPMPPLAEPSCWLITPKQNRLRRSQISIIR